MGIKQDVFGLEQIYRLQVEGQWSTRGDVWNSPSPFLTPQGTDFAYFVGGAPGPKSTVDRIDFTNDTANTVAKGPLTGGRYAHRGTGSSDFGYHGGGRPSPHNRVERIDYGNDTATAVAKGPLSGTHYTLAATGNQNFGYFCGGFSTKSRVSRIDYSNDTATASQKGPLSTGRGSAAATGNQDFGYIAGGTAPDYTSNVERIDYGNDTATASPKGPLNFAKYRLMGSSNADFGYFAGGNSPADPGADTRVERIDYSNDTATASPKGGLANTHGFGIGTGSQNFGYFAGSLGNNSSKIDRVDYSNDTATALDRGLLTVGRYELSASSSRGNANPIQKLQPASSVRTGEIASHGFDTGYFAGGYVSNPVSTIDRVDYANDTATAVAKGPLASAAYGQGGTGNAPFGYFGGGGSPGGNITTVQRVDYSNDTATASVRGPLSLDAARYIAATGNQNFGYFSGGHPLTTSVIQRIDYANDTATAVAKGPSTINSKSAHGATGNADFGYFGGGNPSGISTVERVDYSNDTATAAVKGPLSLARRHLAATGNASFGYFSGGYGPGAAISTVDRIDYSNDTATAAVKGPLSAAKYRHGATGNASFGYFGGGFAPNKSSVDRIDYSNDTATASPKGPLSLARFNPSASSSRANAIPLKGPGNLEVPVLFGAFSVSTPQGTDFGYFAGGFDPSVSSSVSRIDYANDSANASPKGPLTLARGYSGSTGSATHGYFAGGNAPAGTRYTTIDRITYANDTVDAVTKGNYNHPSNQLAATGNANFGYFAGGGIGPFSTIGRLSYSNDGVDTVQRSFLSTPRTAHTAVGNQSFGYFSGGTTPAGSWRSSTDRLDYSNDTATASPKGPLASGRATAAASGNADFGYVMGGVFPSLGYPGSQVDRIDYSNDTATSLRRGGDLNTTSSAFSAAGNSSFGYAAGGQTTPSFTKHSKVQRLDYATDTTDAVLKGPLNRTVNGHAAVSSRSNAIPLINTVNYAQGTLATPHFGYFGGGNPGTSSVNRIDFSNDTATATTKGPLTQARNQLAAVSSSSHGYFAGGYPSPQKSTIDRVDYLNDTTAAAPKGPLSLARYRFAGTDTKDFGYLAAGENPSVSPGTLSSVERVDYSNDSATAVAKGPLAAKRYKHAATGNQSFGYYAGGRAPTKSSIDRLDYSNDTATGLIRGPLSANNQQFAATGNADFGYFGGGLSGRSTVDRVDYSNDTSTASPKGTLSVGRHLIAATGDASFGYFAGGRPGPNKSLIDRVDYSNDTATASPKGSLAAARYDLAGTSARTNGFVPIGPSVVSNVPVQTGAQHYRGYIFGGQGDPSLSPSYNQPTQRIDFTNDTATALVKGSPSPAGSSLYYNFAVGNRNYAYAANLGSPSPASVQRFDYSNETAALVVKGAYNTVLIGASGPTNSVGGYNAAATGNHDYGWTNGGYKLYSVPAPSGYYTAFSQIDRIDYSNDTANASRRSYTTNRFGTGSANGTNDYGYWMGGSTSMPSYSGACTKVDRTDYANDTTNAVAKGNLAIIHGRESDSIANSSYAWIAGGRPYSSTRVDRFDYSNDTTTAVEKGNLAVSMYSQSTTGNQSYGYFCGGSPGPLSSVQRVDYSNDTATASPKGPLAYKNRSSSGASTTYNSLPST